MSKSQNLPSARHFTSASRQEHPRFAPSALVIALCAALAVPCEGLAADWNGTVSNDWSVAGNWTPGMLPTAADNVVLDTVTPNPTTVSDPNAVANNLTVGASFSGELTIGSGGTLKNAVAVLGGGMGSSGSVVVSGPGATWTNSSFLLVANNGTGNLTISNGAAVSSTFGQIASSANGVGTVTVDNASWTNSGALIVGSSGKGTVVISGGGTVSSNSGNIGGAAIGVGDITVSGMGSSWTTNSGTLNVGNSGKGTMTLLNGGAVNSGVGILGNMAGGTGTVTVDNAKWTSNNSIVVGNGGTGSLTLVNGGLVDSVGGTIGGAVGASGTVSVTGTGSAWSNSSILIVGDGGTGSLTISNQGVVGSAQGGVIGNTVNGIGTVTVNGAGSAWNNNSALAVGDFGKGTLAIANGGLVTATMGTIAGQSGSAGTVTVDGAGSTWSNTTHLLVGNAGAGSLTISNSGAVSAGGVANIGNSTGSAGTLAILSGGTLTSSSGSIGGAGSTGVAGVDGNGSSWASTGDLTVGDGGAGTLNVTNGGKVSNANGVIGNQAGLTGTATVSGPGSTWTHSADLLIADAGTGTLAILNGGAVSNGNAMIGNQAGSAGTVTVDGAGSLWTNNGSLTVGGLGAGSLTISNGAVVNATAAATTIGSNAAGVPDTLAILGGGTFNSGLGKIGSNAGSQGSAVVDGAGSTWNNAGVLLVGDSGTGTLTIANGGNVVVGGLLSVGAQGGSTGTLNIGGATGAPAAAPGTLASPLGVQFGAGSGIIRFNHTDTSGNYVFAPALSGLGNIVHGAGWTTMTADSSAFTGQVDVSGGRLAVNGSLAGASAIRVNNDGILGGTGFVGNTFANPGGIIAPGNSIGTLNVNGNVTFAAGSFYQVETNPAGQSDNLLVSGTATLNGGTVQVIGGSGNYSPTTSYTILTAQGGVTGTFAGVTSDLAFLDPSLNYVGNDVNLTLTRNSTPMGSVGQNPAQANTGTGVQGLGAGNPIYGAVLGLSASQARNAFQQLSGEVHASARSVILEDSRFARDASLERLRAMDSEVVANDGGADAAEGKPARLLPSLRDLAYWGRAMGSWGHIDGDANAGTVKRETAGFLMGADTRFGDEGRFGVMGGYSRSTFDVTDRNASGSSDNYHLGAYAGNRWGELALRSGISYSWHDVSTSRVVAFPGFSDSLKADYKAATTQLFAELGWRIKTERAELEPFANLAHVNVSSDGFTERGGPAALTSSGNSSGVTFSTLGLRASTNFSMDGGASVTARGSLGWRHAFGDTAPTSTLAFAGGAPISITGAPIAKSAAVVEAGLDFRLTNTATLGLSYGGQFGSGLKDHSARIHLNVAF